MVGSAEEVSIGPYRIVRRLGFGRKSEVLLATRLFPGNFERRVVIKRLLARGEEEPERQAVIAAEALAYARVAHPAIVQLFDFFSHEGHLALVLEYVDGLSLAKVIEALRARREPLSDRVAIFIASRVFAALAAAHTAKDPRSGEITPVIHRDVSPSNILVPWDGFVKLGDFDLSKVIGVSGDTRGGLMKGTYGYMAPEQVTGDPVTPRTDVYAGCLVLREMLLGRPTFDERLPELELLQAMLQSRLQPIEGLRPGIPRRLADAMARGLARDADQRTLSAAEMVDVLRQNLDPEQAHAELVARLQRIRPFEERGLLSQSAPTPPAGMPAAVQSRFFPTPRTMTLPKLESLAPLASPPSSTRPVARDPSAITLPGVLTAAAVLVLAVAVGLTLRAPASTASELEGAPSPSPVSLAALPSAPPSPPAGTASAAPGEQPAPPSAPAVTAAPSPVSTLGTLIAPPAARHHRIWVDGQLAVWSTGPGLRVPCGSHVVRVGSSGASQSVDVPCGGMVALESPGAR